MAKGQKTGKSDLIVKTASTDSILVGHGYLTTDKKGNPYVALYLTSGDGHSSTKLVVFERTHTKGKIFKKKKEDKK